MKRGGGPENNGEIKAEGEGASNGEWGSLLNSQNERLHALSLSSSPPLLLSPPVSPSLCTSLPPPLRSSAPVSDDHCSGNGLSDLSPGRRNRQSVSKLSPAILSHLSQLSPACMSEIIFLGTGCSTGIPRLTCVLAWTGQACDTCRLALSLPPEINKNYRCTPSAVIRFAREDGRSRFILIDAGKTFREQVIRWFPKFDLGRVDAILLTHHHADAILGLDDVRDVQPRDPVSGRVLPLPVYLSATCMSHVAKQFPYLAMRHDPVTGDVPRRVSQLDWRIIEESPHVVYDVEGLLIRPLPVMHGEDLVALGFLIDNGRQRIAYISDVSRLLPETERQLTTTATSAGTEGEKEREVQPGKEIDLLVLDCLLPWGSHPTHMCLPECLDIIRKLRPAQTLLLGMSHEIEHELINRKLLELAHSEGIHVALAYDGLRVPIML
ncbi:hypothetical protein CBR_g16093 [Chara braunii]|uniref:Metallo-beta-lactamase domain-containing protein n=1 Tax=Chara braunii TaxID=69332 RepID=A0A388KTL5_CHABU|nr:hypothetical protein CBR_g16093 [Chara braunii]|eukprot:GBG73379.1 hypothetical protein CBR_g16093 [Chara braunii]